MNDEKLLHLWHSLSEKMRAEIEAGKHDAHDCITRFHADVQAARKRVQDECAKVYGFMTEHIPHV